LSGLTSSSLSSIVQLHRVSQFVSCRLIVSPVVAVLNTFRLNNKSQSVDVD
jgi:hypothetical protein